MELILVRHAHAGDRDPAKWPDDGLRPISADGRRKQIEAAAGMKRLGLLPDHILTSPLVRALQTAEILAEVLGHARFESVEALGSGCSTVAVVALLARYPAEATLMLVGHEPAFSGLAAALIGHAGDARLDLKKSGVIGIGFAGAARAGTGTLLYLLKPSLLRKCRG